MTTRPQGPLVPRETLRRFKVQKMQVRETFDVPWSDYPFTYIKTTVEETNMYSLGPLSIETVTRTFFDNLYNTGEITDDISFGINLYKSLRVGPKEDVQFEIGAGVEIMTKPIKN